MPAVTVQSDSESVGSVPVVEDKFCAWLCGY